MFIWMVIFGEKNSIGGFSLKETITYLIGTGLISNIISTMTAYHLEKDVQTGALSNLLIKPVSYPFSRLSISLAYKPLNLLVRTLVYLSLAIFFSHKLVITTDFLIVLLTLISVVIAFIINYFLDFLVGNLAFWTTTTEGIRGIFRTINNIFSGDYAPITFFPRWFQSLSKGLPFIYTRYFPMLIYLKKLSMIEAIKGLGAQIFWALFLYFLTRFAWRKGIKRYEGVGI